MVKPHYCVWPTTSPVGSYPAGAGPFGHLDLAGNVWEWGYDWYANYVAKDVDNPIGSKKGQFRVLRGGSWDDLRCADRDYGHPGLNNDDHGFRVAEDYSSYALGLYSFTPWGGVGEFLKFMSDNGNSITKTYDLLKWLLPIISRFPKDKRYTLGQRLENKLLDILECHPRFQTLPKSSTTVVPLG